MNDKPLSLEQQKQKAYLILGAIYLEAIVFAIVWGVFYFQEGLSQFVIALGIGLASVSALGCIIKKAYFKKKGLIDQPVIVYWHQKLLAKIRQEQQSQFRRK